MTTASEAPFRPRCTSQSGKTCNDCVECLSTIPYGLTCASCVFVTKCVAFGVTNPTRRFCDFAPSHFSLAQVKLA